MQYFKTFILMFICIFLISACGKQSDENTYTSYSECMKDEIRKNDGKRNEFINQYCRESFPIKTTKREYTFQMGGSELVVQNEYRNRGDSIRIARETDTTGRGSKGYWLRLYNQSNRNVTFLKVVSYASSTECVNRNINWDNVPNLLPGNQVIKPGESGLVVVVVEWGWC